MVKAKAPERKKKSKKEGPKKPMSAYIFFSNKRRPEIVKDQPSLNSKITQVSKIIGEEWRALDAADKQPFALQAEKDKVRYAKELEEFQKKPKE